jgi:U3 small nucleolar RNA-associated protein 23
MILEPISSVSENVSLSEEKRKFRLGLKSKGRGVLGKRTRDEGDAQAAGDGGDLPSQKKNKKQKGSKGPNPLSILKPKKRNIESHRTLRERKSADGKSIEQTNHHADENISPVVEKKKRRRKPSKRASEPGPIETREVQKL